MTHHGKEHGTADTIARAQIVQALAKICTFSSFRGLLGYGQRCEVSVDVHVKVHLSHYGEKLQGGLSAGLDMLQPR